MSTGYGIPLKALIIEDSKAVCDAIIAVLNRGNSMTVSVGTVEGALAEYRTSRYDVVILDTAVDGHRGLEFIDAITPSQDSTSKSRLRSSSNAPVVVIRHTGEKIPTDCLQVKQEIPFPFTGEELARAVHDSLSAREASKIRDALLPHRDKFTSLADLADRGIVPGGFYVFYERKPIVVKDALKAFADSGYNMFLITASRPKVAKERMGLSGNAEIFILSGHEYLLGSMVQKTLDFISKHDNAVVTLDDLDGVINRCGLDRTLRALSAILRENRSNKTFTFMTSVNGQLFGDSVKDMLGEMMTVFETEV